MSVQLSKKSNEIESFLTALVGTDRRHWITSLVCHPVIGCGKTIEPGEFECYGPATRKEFKISGLCGTCQGSVFGGSTLD